MASPYSTGGGGRHFEARVVAYYLASVLCKAPACGLPGLRAAEVQTQRAAFEEPLDDVIVAGEFEDSRRAKLHLQIKSAITFTEGNEEWSGVLRQAWDTVSAEGFDPTTERVGVGISVYNAKVDQHYQSVPNWAAHSINGDDFVQRIKKKDFSHADKEAFVQTIQRVLAEHVGRDIANDELWGLLRSFVIVLSIFNWSKAPVISSLSSIGCEGFCLSTSVIRQAGSGTILSRGLGNSSLRAEVQTEVPSSINSLLKGCQPELRHLSGRTFKRSTVCQSEPLAIFDPTYKSENSQAAPQPCFIGARIDVSAGLVT